MASYHVKVTKKFETVVDKQIFKVADANKFVKEMKEKYPVPEFVVTREWY